MFCSKCGTEYPDGGTCPFCGPKAEAPASAPATEPTPASTPASAGINLSFPISKIIVLGIAILTFIFQFINWFTASVSVWGYSSSQGFSPYDGSLGDASGMFTFVKLILIIDIVVFIAYIATQLVDIKKFVPALNNLSLDIAKLSSLAFYGLMLVALIFGLIGTFTVETGSGFGASASFSVGFGWFLSLIFTAIGLVNVLKPNILKNALAKANLK